MTLVQVDPLYHNTDKYPHTTVEVIEPNRAGIVSATLEGVAMTSATEPNMQVRLGFLRAKFRFAGGGGVQQVAGKVPHRIGFKGTAQGRIQRYRTAGAPPTVPFL